MGRSQTLMGEWCPMIESDVTVKDGICRTIDGRTFGKCVHKNSIGCLMREEGI